MRRAALLALSLALAACSPPAAQPVSVAALPEGPPEGSFVAVSTTAMGITGDMTLSPGEIAFAEGQLLATEPAGPIGLTTPVDRSGDSFAKTMVLPMSLAIELRRVTAAASATGATPQALCGDATPTYVALAWDTPVSAVSVAVFSGAQAPGPDATDTVLCGVFAYEPKP
jgi:hypothetical protein